MQICKWTSLSSRLFDKSEDFCNMIPLSCKSNWTPRLLQQKVVHLKHSKSFKFLPKRVYDNKTKNRLFTPLLTNHRVANRSNGMSLLVERSLDGRNFVRTGGVRSYDCAAEETQTVSFQTSIQTAVLTKKTIKFNYECKQDICSTVTYFLGITIRVFYLSHEKQVRG